MELYSRVLVVQSTTPLPSLSNQEAPTAEPDRRYRIAVMLQRTDRPENMKWYCPFCQNFLLNLVNSVPVGLADVVDFENTDITGIEMRCNGRLKDGGHCRKYFIFTLGATL